LFFATKQSPVNTLQVKSLLFVQEFFTTKDAKYTKYTKGNLDFPLCSFVTFVVESLNPFWFRLVRVGVYFSFEDKGEIL
jgi:hypothetical protein